MLVAVVLLITVLAWIFVRYKRISDLVKNIPNVSSKKIHLFKIKSSNTFDLYNEISNSYERIGKIWCGPMLVILIDHPDDIKVVLNSKYCLDKPEVYRFTGLGDGLITAREHVWKVYRKHFSHAFSTNALKSFVPVFNNTIKNLLDTLDKKVGGPPHDIFEHLVTFNAEAIYQSSMSIQENLFAVERYGKKIGKIMHRMMEMTVQRFNNLFLHPDFIYKFTWMFKELQTLASNLPMNTVERLTEEFDNKSYIDNNHERAEEDDPKKFLILKNILEMMKNGEISETTFQHHLLTILFAGIDTTSATVSAALMMLALYPDVQEKAYNEIITVCGVDADYYDFEAVSKLKYLECIFKETMRLYPILPVIARTATADIELENHRIPKDTMILIDIYKAHKNQTFWGTNVDQFDPDRFLENGDNRHPCAYLPFSSGQRICLGNRYAMVSMKIQMCHLLTHFKFTTDLKIPNIQLKIAIFLKFANGYHLRLHHRKLNNSEASAKTAQQLCQSTQNT